MDEAQPAAGIDRRKVITRGTAAAGMFWAVPVISSVANPAAAQAVGTPGPGGGGTPDCPPENVISVFVKFEVDSGLFVTATGGGGSCISGGCEAANAFAAAEFNAGADVEIIGEQVCITIPEGFLMIEAAAGKEGNRCDDSPDAGSDDLPGGRTVCFTKDIAGSVSNVVIKATVCVPSDVLADCP